MHWIEGIPLIAAGCAAWMIAAGSFSGTPQMRERMRVAAPWTQKKSLMRTMAVFLWFFGGAVLLGLVD